MDSQTINGEVPEQPIQDADMEEDKARSEATFRYVVHNFSKMKELQLSPPCYVRNLPWKIMVMPRISPMQDRQQQRSLGFFLQCNGESESSTWSCYAKAELRLITQREGAGITTFSRKVQHLFCCKENDWGFSHFLAWNDVLDPEKGYIKDDTIILEVHVAADAPHSVSWDSKQHTGYVGLKNQGVTSYRKAHLYMTVQVLLEDSFCCHQGNDLFDPDRVSYKVFRVKKSSTLQELMDHFADAFKYSVEQLRMWPFHVRSNQTCRPTPIDLEADLHKNVQDISESQNPWNVFLECVPRDSGLTALPPFDKKSDVLLFFKMYDPQAKRILYCGHHYMPVISKVQELIPMLNERAGFPPDTELLLFEEVKPNLVERITNFNEPLEKVLEELMDGDIFVFQKKQRKNQRRPNATEPEVSTCQEYFRDLFYRVEVTFCDKMIPNDPGFKMELSMQMGLEQLSIAVAQRVVGADPSHLQFFKTQMYKDGPGNPVWSTFEGTLKDLLVYSKPKGV